MYETTGRALYGASGEQEAAAAFSPSDIALLGRHSHRHRQTNHLYRWMRIGAVKIFGATAGDSYHPVTVPFLARNGLASTPPRCVPTEPTFGTLPTMGCGGLGRSARARPRMGYVWCAFWMTKDRLSFFLLPRATRRCQELYEVLGVYTYTWLAGL